MNIHNSVVSNVGVINFPKFRPERIYMHKFYKKSGLPVEYRHWQDTVDQMLDKVDVDEPIYLMVDSAFVKANQTHRREGRHIDGYWVSGSHSTHGGLSTHSSHGSSIQHKDNWSNAKLNTPEALILASNQTASRGFIGDWSGVIGDGGSCENIDITNMQEILLEKNNIYISNVGFIHESIPVKEDCERTLIRLNVKNWDYL